MADVWALRHSLDRVVSMLAYLMVDYCLVGGLLPQAEADRWTVEEERPFLEVCLSGWLGNTWTR